MTHFLKHAFGLALEVENNILSAKQKNEVIELEVRVFDKDSGNGGIDPTKIKSLIQEIELSKIPVGIKSLIIIDCDTPAHSPPGGFEARTKYLKNLCGDTKIEFFLIPNNCDEGNLENLLDRVISQEGKAYYCCLGGFIDCLKNLNETETPSGLKRKDLTKLKMRWYSHNMNKEYRNPNAQNFLGGTLWDLDSNDLLPLKKCLEAFLGL